MRVTPLYDLDEFDKQLHQWCREAAGEDGYKIKWIQRFHAKNLTSVEKGNKWWDAFSSVMDGFDAKLIKTIFPGLNTLTYLRLVQTQTILATKSMLERDGSDIDFKK